MTIIACVIIVVVFVFMVKAALWSGSFPPDRGWSKRQMQRMDEGKSPWTILCALTYSAEREREIKDSVASINKPAPHVHKWQDPPLLSGGKNDRDTIEFALVGQVCACGARRVFEGPSRGFRMLPVKS